MATSGANRHVIDSIDRNTVLSDLSPDNIVYRGKKKRTGKYNNRHEELVVSRTEPKGIHERLKFTKEITEPLLKWRSSANSANTFWLGITFDKTRSRKIIELDRGSHDRCNKTFCSIFGLQKVAYGEKGKITDLAPMAYIDSRRLRKTNVFKDMAEQVPFHVIEAALADGTFEMVFKYYIDNDVQRQENFKAIAVLQNGLMQEMNAYSLEIAFAGEIICDTFLSDAKDVSDNFLSACPQYTYSGVQLQNSRCNVAFGRFDFCLGCKNSRVFREHLPGICFRIIQYDQAKTSMPNPDWEASYSIHRHRAINCLEKYSNHGKTYAQHVDAAWVVAKSEGGVYMPPLI